MPPDVTPPGVAITSPASGATVAGSVNVLGTASDNVGLSQVEVRVDSGVWNLASGLGNWSYALNTLSLADGAHTIAAERRILSGNTSQATRSVTVDNTAPVITGVNASAITTSQATIGWQTNELSDSRVEYGLTASYGSFSALQASPRPQSQRDDCRPDSGHAVSLSRLLEGRGRQRGDFGRCVVHDALPLPATPSPRRCRSSRRLTAPS